MLLNTLPLAAILPDFFWRNLAWILAALILIVGVLVGFGDLRRFSVRRIWAISGVCFDESIRRRILWITPVAILGIIVVSQLQKPLDEQDAIRQTVKICLFTTGLLVVVSTIVLACTNLPREIENRVIYTVVTKPTTRLEIVVGKVVGFARVSFVILAIMGVFTFSYLTLRAWSMHRYIAGRADASGMAESTRQTLRHYQDSGLLTARTLQMPADMQMFAELPPLDAKRWYMGGGNEAVMLTPFEISKDALVPPGVTGAKPGDNGAYIVLRIGYRPKVTPPAAPNSQPATTQPAATGPATSPVAPPYYGPYVMSPEARAAILAEIEPQANPTVAIEVMDRFLNGIGSATHPMGNLPLELTNKQGLSTVVAQVPANVAGLMGGQTVYIRVSGTRPDGDYYVEDNPVALRVQARPEQILAELQQRGFPEEIAGRITMTLAAANAGIPEAKAAMAQIEQEMVQAAPQEQKQEVSRLLASFAPKQSVPLRAMPIFQGRSGTFGQQLAGHPMGDGPVGVLAFRNTPAKGVSGGQVTFEGRFGVERSGAELITDFREDQPTELSVRVRSIKDGKLTEPVIVKPESNRPAFFTLPAELVADGNFDLVMRTLTPGHYVGLRISSVSMIADRQPFAWNLSKSLLILWLMSVLVTAVAIFTSTFLSWPIAVVLTLLILLGHWGVQQLGDATQPGIGNQIVTDLGMQDAAPAKALSATVERLSWFLNVASTILPDISKFTAVEDIERGVTVSPQRIGRAGGVALGFGIPLTVLAYVVLKNKEVAP